MMKKTLLLLIVLTSFARGLFAMGESSGNSSGKGKKTVWKLGHIASGNHPWNDISLYFADKVKEYSNETLEIEVFPSSQLGGEVDNINGIRGGTADMTLTGETLQNWAPLAALMAVPYAFSNETQLLNAVDGEIGKRIVENIEEKAELKPLFYILRAPRNLTSNRAITKPEELKGMRLRVPNVPIFVDTWKALGAKPTPMAFQEVFTALQQNTIEGQENPYDLIYSAGFYEVQKYVNVTEHVRQWIYAVVGMKQWNRLNEEQKAAVEKASAESQKYAYNVYKTGLERYKGLLIEKEMKMVEVDQDAFRKKAEPAIIAALNKEQLALFETIQ